LTESLERGGRVSAPSLFGFLSQLEGGDPENLFQRKLWRRVNLGSRENKGEYAISPFARYIFTVWFPSWKDL